MINNKSALTDESRRFLHTLDQLGVLNTDINTIITAIEMNGTNKSKRKRKKKTIKLNIDIDIDMQKVYHNTTLPYCGKIIKHNCLAMRKNHGLYTQCKNAQLKNCDYCAVCLESSKNSSTEKPKYGDIRERDCLIEQKIIKVINFGNIVEKLQLDRNKCIKDADKLGWMIPDDQWEIKKTKRGRPKTVKTSIVVVEDSETDEYEMSEMTEDDIIAHLISNNAK